MHIALKAANLTREVAASVLQDSLHDLVVYISNGADQPLVWLEEAATSGVSCSFRELRPGCAGFLTFSGISEKKASATLRVAGPRGERLSILVHNPCVKAAPSAQLSVIPEVAPHARASSSRAPPQHRNSFDLGTKAVRVRSVVAEGCSYSAALLSGDVQQVATGRELHVFVGKSGDFAQGEVQEALRGPFGFEMLNSQQLLQFAEWCRTNRSDSLAAALFLMECAAVFAGLSSLDLRDRAFAMDLLIAAFLGSGALTETGAVAGAELDAHLKSWRDGAALALARQVSPHVDYAEYCRRADSADGLAAYAAASGALLKTAALQCGLSLCGTLELWDEKGRPGEEFSLLSGTLAQHRSHSFEHTGHLLMEHLQSQDWTIDDRGVDRTRCLATNVRECIETAALLAVRQRALFEELCGSLPQASTWQAVMRYRQWVPSTLRTFSITSEWAGGWGAPRGCSPCRCLSWRKAERETEANDLESSEVLCECIGAELFAGIDSSVATSPEQLMQSLGCKSLPYKTMATNSKSGEFFYFSGDRKFLIKTISADEGNLLHRMLPGYQAHLRGKTRSLIVRYAGLYRVLLPQIGWQYFSIMVSVFDPEFPIHQTFDLKGSLQGRKRKDNENISKDVDWIAANEPLLVAPKVRAQLCAAHERDVSFLAGFGVMDYSILVGIHDPDDQNSSVGSVVQPVSRKSVASRKSMAGSDGSWTDAHGGVILAAGSKRVYSVGIIDFLIWYGLRKMGESLGRALTGHEEDASCVDPLSYARRQVSFVRDHVLPKPADGEFWGTVGTLRVTFIEGLDLINADILSMSDPYGRLELGFQRQRTRTIQNNNNPKWHEVLYAAVNEEHLRQNIELSIWDDDDKTVQGDDDFLGRLVIPVRSVGQEAQSLEIVEPLQGVPKGRLSVKLELFSSNRSDVAPPPPMPAQPD